MAEKFNFNKGLSKLEEIINKMDSGELSLEESLKFFEEGVKIHRQCHSALKNAEQRISVLTESDEYNEERSFEDSWLLQGESQLQVKALFRFDTID